MKPTVAFATFLLAPVSVPAIGALPTDVVPLLYDIEVRPDAAASTFSGAETVTVDVRRPTSRIVLNAAELAGITATVDGVSAPVTLDAAAQTLTLSVSRPLTAGRHSIAFRWTGRINRAAAGLFAIDYTGTDGRPTRMLATQFEAPDARRFAPMWDEPAFKARFRLTATAPAGQTACSNMPATATTVTAGGSRTYRFAETPLMSSYLLYLGIGDIDRRTATVAGTEIGIISRRGVAEQGGFALASAGKLLTYYNDYFGQPYPLPKMDMIAGPGSSQFFGAMENWGAIFYFEPTLLFDPARTGTAAREGIYITVAHEMAHQWFGNLVTMRWWNDLWLNEGFASWMEVKATADLNPDWQLREAAIAFDRESAMAIDATSATHPIVRPVETVDQIGEAFDSITYKKGQAVIGMIEGVLGADAFRAGIRRYMARHRYANTESADLYADLSVAAGRDVAALAHDFTTQGGVPLVTLTDARCVGGSTRLTVAQGRFGLDPQSQRQQVWRVPMTVGIAGGASTAVTVTGARPQSVTIRGCGTVVLNTGKTSYLRTRYDAASHAALVRDYAAMPLADRLGTLGDDFALGVAGYQGLDAYLALQGRVGVGADPLEWMMVAARMNVLREALGDDPLADAFTGRSRAMMSPVLARIGWDARADESFQTGKLREALIESLGAFGDPAVIGKARRYVAALTRDPLAIPGAIRQPILATFATNATAADWDRLLTLARGEQSPVVRNHYINLLGYAADPAVAARALALLSGDFVSDPQKASLLQTVASSHADLAFDYAVARRAAVEAMVEQSSRSGYIVGLGQGSDDPAMPGKIRAFADRHLAAGSRGPADRAIALIAGRAAANGRLRTPLARWLGVGTAR